MRTIEIDNDVWHFLQKQARPLEDTPNSILRRLLCLGGLQRRKRKAVGTTHGPRSMRHTTRHREIWGFGLPPLGKRYKQGDAVILHLLEFIPGGEGRVRFLLEGEVLRRILQAVKDTKGYTHVKVWRETGG